MRGPMLLPVPGSAQVAKTASSDSTESIYRRYWPLVYSRARSLVCDHHLAEDVAQAVFLKFLARPEAFRGGNVEAWLTRVSMNCAIDALRLRRHSAKEALIDRIVAGSTGDDVANEIVLRAFAGDVRTALLELHPKERDLLVSAFLKHRTHRELSRSTGLPLGTVKTRIRRGLKRLRVRLAALREPEIA